MQDKLKGKRYFHVIHVQWSSVALTSSRCIRKYILVSLIRVKYIDFSEIFYVYKIFYYFNLLLILSVKFLFSYYRNNYSDNVKVGLCSKTSSPYSGYNDKRDTHNISYLIILSFQLCTNFREVSGLQKIFYQVHVSLIKDINEHTKLIQESLMMLYKR